MSLSNIEHVSKPQANRYDGGLGQFSNLAFQQRFIQYPNVIALRNAGLYRGCTARIFDDFCNREKDSIILVSAISYRRHWDDDNSSSSVIHRQSRHDDAGTPPALLGTGTGQGYPVNVALLDSLHLGRLAGHVAC